MPVSSCGRVVPASRGWTSSPAAGVTGYVDEIVRLVDTVGADHVAIGTDMDGILPQSVIFDDYAEWPSPGVSPGSPRPGRARDEPAKEGE